jgi:hypothetical protein
MPSEWEDGRTTGKSSRGTAGFVPRHTTTTAPRSDRHPSTLGSEVAAGGLWTIRTRQLSNPVGRNRAGSCHDGRRFTAAVGRKRKLNGLKENSHDSRRHRDLEQNLGNVFDVPHQARNHDLLGNQYRISRVKSGGVKRAAHLPSVIFITPVHE